MKLKLKLFKGAILFFGAIILLFTTLIGIQLFTSTNTQVTSYELIFIAAILLTVYFSFNILFNLFKVVDLIAKKQAFTEAILRFVKRIKKTIFYLACSFCGVLPLVYHGADIEDAPGLMLLGIGVVLIPFAIFLFAQIVEELFKSAIELQKENDLTV